jgi:hypothetical protein
MAGFREEGSETIIFHRNLVNYEVSDTTYPTNLFKTSRQTRFAKP